MFSDCVIQSVTCYHKQQQDVRVNPTVETHVLLKILVSAQVVGYDAIKADGTTSSQLPPDIQFTTGGVRCTPLLLLLLSLFVP